jgi:beta-apo-4'-carotenal oxygenase
MDDHIPDLKFSSPEAIFTCISTTRKSFLEHRTRDVEFRLVQLRKLYWACVIYSFYLNRMSEVLLHEEKLTGVLCSIKDHEDNIVRACALDLNKPRFETEVAESGWLLNDIVFTTRNLHKWVKDENAEDIDLHFKMMRPKIRKDPLGCVLVIGYVLLFCES